MHQNVLVRPDYRSLCLASPHLLPQTQVVQAALKESGGDPGEVVRGCLVSLRHPGREKKEGRKGGTMGHYSPSTLANLETQGRRERGREGGSEGLRREGWRLRGE